MSSADTLELWEEWWCPAFCTTSLSTDMNIDLFDQGLNGTTHFPAEPSDHTFSQLATPWWSDLDTNSLTTAAHATDEHDNFSSSLVSSHVEMNGYRADITHCQAFSSFSSDSTYLTDFTGFEQTVSDSLQDHIDDVAEHAEPTCADCQLGFDTFLKLEKHGRDLNHLPFRCPVTGCTKRLARRDTLKRHRDLHLSTKRLVCEKCKGTGPAKFFKRKEHLRQHERRCNGQNDEKQKLKEMIHTLRPVLDIELDMKKMEERIDGLPSVIRKSCLKDLRSI